MTPAQHVLPASFAQQRLWFFTQLVPDVAVYNIGFLQPLPGACDPDRVRRVLTTIASRHETMRTALSVRDGVLCQVVHREPLVGLEIGDVDGDGRIQELLAADSAVPFDLERAPLWRARLVRRGERDAVLAFVVHHAVFDAQSARNFVRELRELWADEHAAMPELAIQYADFAAWQRDQLDAGALDEQLEYWRRRLADLPADTGLPTDRARPPHPSHHGADVTIELPVAANRAVRRFARDNATTPYAVLLAAFVALVSRLSGRTDVVVGSPVAGRQLPELAPLLGMFVNSLVLRTDCAGDPTFRALLDRATDTVADALEHADVPFDRLVEELAPERDPSRSPLYQVVLNLMPDTGAPQTGNGTAKVDLILDLYDTIDGTLGARMEYATDLFDALTAKAVLDRYAQLLGAALAAPDTRLSELPVLLPGEPERLLAAASGHRAAGSVVPEPVLARFRRQVAERPAATAVRDSAGVELTYRELADRAEALAARLVAHGAGPERRVALLLDTDADLVVAVLGVLLSGSAYLPLDVEHPAGRIAHLLTDTAPVAVVTTSAHRHLLPHNVPVVDPAPSPDAAESTVDGAPAAMDLPGALAYVVHTSGSTGRPKGVGVTRANLAAYVDGLVRLLDPRPGATWAMLQPLTFDFAVTTFFGALLTGGTLCPVARERATDAAWLARHRADYLKITPSHLAALRAAVTDPAELLPATALVLGGEASRWADVQELRALGRCDVLNHYGPTETTVGVLALPADGVAHPVGPHTPIGWPLAGADAHVLDEHGRPVPDGVVGELCVGGDTVARGYLGQPGLTAQRFVPDPFSGRGARLYRTGDRVRRLPCGAVEFLGRADDQVKIRGYRVEPGEVRHALTTHPDVAEAAVLARDDRLVGYLVPTPGRRPDPSAVLRHAADELPRHLVPSALVVLDELPLTPHGKLDHARLPDPEPSTVDAAAGPPASSDAVSAPSGAVEEVVAALFGELLDREVHDRDASFFAIGGHSLLGIRLMTRMRKAFGVSLPLREVFEDPTVAGIAARVTTRLRGGGADDLPPIEPVPRDRPLPASHGQQRLWFLDQFDADTPLYNTHFTLRLTGTLDVDALRAALVEIVRRHEILRTRFAASADGLVQVPHPHPELPFATAELPRGASDRERWELLTDHASRRFDLATDPPLRALLVRTGDDRHDLLLTLHHTVFDGSSVAVLVGELARLYPAMRDGGDAGLPDLPVQYADFAAWQRAVVAGELADTQLEYWRRRLAGLPPRLELPTDRPRPRRLGAGGQHQLFAVPPEVADRLRSVGAEEGATLFMALLAGYAVLLRRYTGQRDLAVGVPLITRQRPELEPLIGFFVNTLVLRVEAAGDPSFRELVRIARTSTVEAYAHSDVPFEALVDELAPERDQGVTPLVQTMFMLADDQRALSLDLGGLTADFEPFALGHAKFDVSFFLWRRENGLTGAVEYRPELFDDATMTRFVAHFVDLLTAAAATPDAPVSTLSTPTAVPAPAAAADSPAASAPAAIGGSAAPAVSDGAGVAGAGGAGGAGGVTVVDLVRERVRLAPAAVAVRDGDTELSYAELWRRAEALAARLPSGAVVGVCVPRSADLVVSLLGVLVAGSAYLPLDADYPPARLAHAASDSGMAALVATPDTRTLVPFAGPALTPDGLTLTPDGFTLTPDGLTLTPDGVALTSPPVTECDTGPHLGDECHIRSHGARPGGVAYVLYTSGSTGLPKGVVVGHAALANQLRWVVGEFGLGERDRVAQRTSAGFDASVWELFAPLVAGGSVVTVPAGVAADPRAVVELVRGNGITVLQLVPTLLVAYLDASVFVECPSLRLVGCGGEALPQELADRFAAQSEARLVNLYGPTECCVQAVFATARAGAERATVPIGVPVPGVTVAVLDEAANPVPDGVPGELYLGGVQVAHGYLGRAALTAERFVPDPAGPPGARRYRTGDRVRLLPGGELEYLSRLDGQVKVRGVRVELGEVEAALADLPEVTRAVAVLRDLTAGPTLVGYVLGPEASTSAALRERLRQRLPAAALPAAVVVLDAFPVLPNGKVDRAALPDPVDPAVAEGYVAPATPTEELLCGLYERLLGRDRVGVRDDFFALGGHSLLVTRLVAGIADELGVDLPLRACFDAPTVAELAIVVLQAQLTEDDLDRLLLELSQDQDRESR